MSTSSKQQGCKITLYWLNESGAQRIACLLEELNLDYELKVFMREMKRGPQELKEVHPLGKSPILEIQPQVQRNPSSLPRVEGSSNISLITLACR